MKFSKPSFCVALYFCSHKFRPRPLSKWQYIMDLLRANEAWYGGSYFLAYGLLFHLIAFYAGGNIQTKVAHTFHKATLISAGHRFKNSSRVKKWEQCCALHWWFTNLTFEKMCKFVNFIESAMVSIYSNKTLSKLLKLNYIGIA